MQLGTLSVPCPQHILRHSLLCDFVTDVADQTRSIAANNLWGEKKQDGTPWHPLDETYVVH